MTYVKEPLKEPVSYQTLEGALKKAAEETGLKIESDVNPGKECNITTFYLKGPIFKSMEIHVYNHGKPIDFFSVYAGPPSGRASKRKVNAYVGRVHDYLEKH